MTWNFLEAGHGKGPADGIGAAVKRRADDIIARGKDIPDAQVLFEELKKQKSATELFYIEPETIEEMDVHVPSELQTIRGTMKIHQVWFHCCFFIHFMVLLLFFSLIQSLIECCDFFSPCRLSLILLAKCHGGF